MVWWLGCCNAQPPIGLATVCWDRCKAPTHPLRFAPWSSGAANADMYVQTQTSEAAMECETGVEALGTCKCCSCTQLVRNQGHVRLQAYTRTTSKGCPTVMVSEQHQPDCQHGASTTCCPHRQLLVCGGQVMNMKPFHMCDRGYCQARLLAAVRRDEPETGCMTMQWPVRTWHVPECMSGMEPLASAAHQ